MKNYFLRPVTVPLSMLHACCMEIVYGSVYHPKIEASTVLRRAWDAKTPASAVSQAMRAEMQPWRSSSAREA